MAVGMMEILFLFFFSTSSGDVVSVMSPADYFQTRNVPMNVDKMTELAVTDPSTGKAQIQQLLALRWLEENAEKVKKDKNAAAILKKIEAIARGQKAQDLQGFASEYAARTAHALGAKIDVPTRTMPENSMRQDAMNWFPKEATFVAGIDFRHQHGLDPKAIKAMRDRVLGMLPPNQKEQIYSQLEKLGNVQVSCYSIALVDDPNPGKMKIYMRLTGKADHKRLVNMYKQIPGPNLKITTEKTFRGRKITIIEPNKGRPPVIALVGDNDMIMAGYEREGDNMALVKKMLAIRRGKEPGVLAGDLAGKLKKLSPKAVGIVAGQLPEEMRRSIMRGPKDFQVFPQKLVAEMVAKGKSFEVKLKTGLDNAADAKTFVNEINNLKTMALQALQNPPALPAQIPLPKDFFDNVRKTVKSIKVQAKGQAVTGGMTLPAGLANGGVLMSSFFFSARSVPQAAPRPIEKGKK